MGPAEKLADSPAGCSAVAGLPSAIGASPGSLEGGAVAVASEAAAAVDAPAAVELELLSVSGAVPLGLSKRSRFLLACLNISLATLSLTRGLD